MCLSLFHEAQLTLALAALVRERRGAGGLFICLLAMLLHHPSAATVSVHALLGSFQHTATCLLLHWPLCSRVPSCVTTYGTEANVICIYAYKAAVIRGQDSSFLVVNHVLVSQIFTPSTENLSVEMLGITCVFFKKKIQSKCSATELRPSPGIHWSMLSGLPMYIGLQPQAIPQLVQICQICLSLSAGDSNGIWQGGRTVGLYQLY